MEGTISGTDELRSLQLRKLTAGLDQVLRSNPFWRERLHAIRGWDDFERLPFTTKADLVADQHQNPPFGTNLTFPLERYVRLHQTSGSSGARPLRWLDTEESWRWWLTIWTDHVYRAAGVGPEDRVFFGFSFGPFIGFWSAFGGAERLGALTVPAGAMTTEQRIRAIQELRPTVFLCTPTYALRLAEAAAQHDVDLAAASIRVTIHAGEAGASIPATREAIERAYGATCVDHSGMTELGPTGFSCTQRDGLHLVESEFIFEVLDGDGRPAAEGELVATNLGRWGTPLVRYRTGDRVQVSSQACGCGSPFLKLAGGISGRVDDMFTVRGVNLYPSQVEAIVRRHAAVKEFLIERRRIRHMDEVTLVIDCGTAAAPGETLSVELRQALGVRIDVRVAAPDSLPRSEAKSVRVVTVVEEVDD